MTETVVDLGTVNAPSGMLVLGMAGWIDYWPQAGGTLSERARIAIAAGGGAMLKTCGSASGGVPRGMRRAYLPE
ncbi:MULTISPECIES: hypothetical protein [Streptomyces]|uniref:hypothetical protein n=1 Tax=Streptomyces TaxID=1883 RepID=UPI00131CFB08|nr:MULTISPECIES: hypothetical protein [Streptomyces]MDI5910747.1 hypothetical protein [Streptomyces sp. 12257]